MKEVWKPITEFNGRYEVSSIGRVRKTNNRKVDVLKHQLSKKGYPTIRLCINKKKYSRSIHRLVATEFIPNPEDKQTVNHINGIKNDNRIENLEWMTNEENIRHAFKNGAFKDRDKNTIINLGSYADGSPGSKNANSKLNEKQVLEIRRLRNKGYKLMDISKIYKINISHISAICNRKAWKHI